MSRFDRLLAGAGLESLTDQLTTRLKAGGPVRLLEIGCGEGRLMLDLFERFGDAIEIHGINDPHWAVIADARGLRATNERYGVVDATRLRRARRGPAVHLADAQNLKGLPPGTFDFIVSQMAVPHIRRKDRVLEESSRLLSTGGVFIHEIDQLDRPARQVGGREMPRWAIISGRELLPSTSHLERHGIRIDRGGAFVFATYRRAAKALDLRLTLDPKATFLLKALPPRKDGLPLWGVRSVYRRRRGVRSPSEETE